MPQVYGVDSLYVWTVAWTKPGIQRSTDGGQTWDSLPGPAGSSNVNFNSVYFHNRNLGWIVTTGGSSVDAGKFFKTTDGGQTWQQLSNPVVGVAQYVVFLDSLNGWACGATDQLYYYADTSGTEAGIVWRTIDGGNTWTYQRLGKPEYGFRTIQMLPSGFGVTVGNTGDIYYTSNFGANWQARNPNLSTMRLRQVHFWNATSGYLFAGASDPLATPQGFVYRSDDSGRSWRLMSELNALHPANIPACVMDSLTIYLAANGLILPDYEHNVILKSTDGGHNWSREYDVKAQANLWNIQVRGNYGWAVGSQIWRYQYTPVTNHRPQLEVALYDTVAYGGTPYRVSYLAFDTDPGDKVRVTLDYSITPSWLTVDSLNSRLSGLVPSPMVGSFFRFRLVATDSHGDSTTYTSRSIRIDRETGVEEVVIPSEFSLSQNYPNPFNPSTAIEYALPFEVDVLLSIHDVLGREVAVLERVRKPAGTYEVRWDGRDYRGREVAGGVYFYRLQAGHVQLTRKLLVVR